MQLINENATKSGNGPNYGGNQLLDNLLEKSLEVVPTRSLLVLIGTHGHDPIRTIQYARSKSNVHDPITPSHYSVQ